MTFYIDGDDNDCHSRTEPLSLIHQLNQGSPIHEPSIGYLTYSIRVTNPSKSASLVLVVNGQLFQGDRYFTYDWNADIFLTGGSCDTYGTIGIEEGTVIVNTDDGNGNLSFQPTNPSNLTGDEVTNHPSLNWNASLPSFSTIKYKVWCSISGGAWSVVASNLTATNYVDNSYTLDGCYDVDYKVSAYTSKNSPSYSNTVSYTATITTPANFQVQNVPNGIGLSPELTWASQPDIAYYELVRSWNGGPYGIIAWPGASETSYMDGEVFISRRANPSTVHYKLRAFSVCNQYSGYAGPLVVNHNETGGWKQIAENPNPEVIPETFILRGAFPNPFNATTNIAYALPVDAFVAVTVYDIMGREVTTLVNGFVNAGFKETVWNGANASGQTVPSGMYFYQLNAKAVESGERFHQTRKMVMMR